MEEQAGFKTSMFGFRKADVLVCIDRMSAEKLAVQDAAMAREQALEESLANICSENAALAVDAEEKDAEISTLRNAIVQQQSLVYKAEAKAVSVQQQLAEAETSAHDYKTRLFASEGEATILRRDNAQLIQAISQKEKALEVCEQSATMQTAAMQDKMKASARDMTEDVRLLKEALATLDEKIESSLHDLQRSTDSLSKALEATEQNMQSLGIKLEMFPEVHEVHKVPSARAAQHHNAPASAQAATAHVHATHKHPLPKSEVKSHTISSMLLAKIGKMIGEV